MVETSEAREHRDRGVTEAHQRAGWAVGALIATAIGYAGLMALMMVRSTMDGPSSALWPIYVAALGAQGVLFLGLRLVTGVLFLRWLARTVTTARDLAVSPPLAWTASEAVWGFFIPVVNLFRPYQVMRDLHDRLAPDGVPEPAPKARLDGAGGYRRVQMEKAPPPRALPHASIGAWWGLYLFGGLIAKGTTMFFGAGLPSVSMIGMTASAGALAEVASAGLAILAVRSIDARLAERQRRLHHATDEELTEWGIDV